MSEVRLNIGAAAQASGVSAKMIRYYGSVGLVPDSARSASGYRRYVAADVLRLRFVRRARDLGFSLERIRELLRLWSDRSRPNAEVRAVASAHLAELEGTLSTLQEVSAALRHLIESCAGEDRADCPILGELGGTRTGRCRAVAEGCGDPVGARS